MAIELSFVPTMPLWPTVIDNRTKFVASSFCAAKKREENRKGRHERQLMNFNPREKVRGKKRRHYRKTVESHDFFCD